VTLIAALLLGAGFVLQQHAAQQAPKALFLRLALIKDLLRRRRWLVGLAVMVAGELASAWSVSHLTLSVAEPLLTTSLIFALALAVPLSRQRLRATEMAGAVLLLGGVAALSVAREATSPAKSFSSPFGWLGAAAIAVIAFIFVQAGIRRSGRARATLTGTAAGLVFGIADALTRQSVHIMDTHRFATLLTTWPGYSLLGASLVGLWLMESAFNAAPLHASLPGISAGHRPRGDRLRRRYPGLTAHDRPAGDRCARPGRRRRHGGPRSRAQRPAARPAAVPSRAAAARGFAAARRTPAAAC